MTWFKVDDQFGTSRKVVRAAAMRGGLAALGLWVRAGSWSQLEETNGVIDLATVKMLGGTRAHTKVLVDARLWDVHEAGWRFHNWEDYQPPPDDKEAKRAAARQRMRDLRSRRKRINGDGERSQGVREHSPDVRDSSPPVLGPDPVPDPEPNPEKNPRESDSPFSGPPVEPTYPPPGAHSLAGQFVLELNSARPEGCRRLANSDIPRIATCLDGREVSHVRAVVADVRDRILSRDLDVDDWSKLWARGGEIFGIREQELEKRQGKRKKARPDEWEREEEKPKPVHPEAERLAGGIGKKRGGKD